MKNYISFLLLTGFFFAGLVSCKKSDVLSFQAQSAVNFTGTSSEYSFLGNATGEYIEEIPVRIIGEASSKERYFSAEVVRDTVTTAADNLYEIIGGVVPADSYTGVLRVKVKNDPSLRTQKVAVKVRIISAGDFVAGNTETSTFIVRWSEQIVVPAWTYFRYFFTSVASTKAYQLIVQTTGLKTLTATEYQRVVTPAGAEALGRVFGDYVKQWNLDHPNDILLHDDGTKAGQPIVPLYWTKSKYN